MTALITSGSKNVTINGLPAARDTDTTDGITDAEVTGVTLGGLSVANSDTIQSTDSLLSGMGKLQAQMSNEVLVRQTDVSNLTQSVAVNTSAIATKANSSALTAVYSAIPAGTNSLSNPGFESNQIGSFDGSLSTTHFSDGWTMQGYSGTENYWWNGAAHNSNYGLLERISIGTVIPANSVGTVYTRIWSNIIKASPGDSITYGVDTRVSSGSLPAGVSVYGRVGLYGCDVNGNDIAEIPGYLDTPGINVGGIAEWQTLTVPNLVMPSGYSFTRMVLMMYVVNTTSTDVTVSDHTAYAEFDNAFVYINVGSYSGQGYIDGLKMVWNSANSISVTSGSAYIPSLAGCLYSGSSLTLSGLVLTASTWYHVYLYENGTTPAIECVTTTPDVTYNGTARAKTGDTSRRYIGSVLTDASGNLYPFSNFSGRITYDSGNAFGPFNVLNTGAATVSTNIDLSAVVPVSAVSAMLRCANNSTTANQQLQKSVGSAVFCSIALSPSGTGAPVFLDCPIANQAIAYLTGGSGGSANVGVVGYTYER